LDNISLGLKQIYPLRRTLEVLGSHSQFQVSMCVHGSYVYTVMLVMMINNVLFSSALQGVMSSTAVREGQTVTLTCNPSCPAHANPTYFWYQDRKLVSNQHTMRDNTLILNSVSSKDSGNYSCALSGEKDHPSPAVTLIVRCMLTAFYQLLFTVSRLCTSVSW